MPEEKKPVLSTKDDKRTVLESDLIAFKKASQERERRLKEELATTKSEVAEVKSQLKIAKASLEDDEEVAKVRQWLIDEDKRITAEREKVEKDLTSLTEREREVRVKSLAAQHSVEIDLIKDAEDPEKEALRLVAERLTKEAEELKKKSAPESLYETGTPGSVKAQPKDMPDAEFQKYVAGLRKEALSKK
jgi:hypothetical protein